MGKDMGNNSLVAILLALSGGGYQYTKRCRMTIDEAIENLQSGKKEGVKNIVLAWWSAADFDRNDNDDWADAAATVEHKMDWSNTHNQLSDFFQNLAVEAITKEDLSDEQN